MYWAGHSVTVPWEEQKKWIVAYQATSDDAQRKLLRDKILQANFGLIISQASKYEKAYKISSEDLFQEGILGLCKALDKFDFKHNAQFNTYATYWANLFIIQYIKKNSRIVNVTEYANLQISLLKKENHKKLRLRWGEYKYIEFLNLLTENNYEEPGDDIDYEDDGMDDVRSSISSKIINGILKTLSVREKVIVRCRYPLHGNARKKLDEIGAMYNITKECIRQIERKAINKIKARLQKTGITSFGEIHD